MNSRRLEKRRDRPVFLLHALGGARQADLGQSGAHRRLPGDESCAAGGAALLAVTVGEDRALLRDAVDVRRLVAHHAHVVSADVEAVDVIAPDDEDVRFVGGQGGARAEKQEESSEQPLPRSVRSPIHGCYPLSFTRKTGRIYSSLRKVRTTRRIQASGRSNDGVRGGRIGLAGKWGDSAHLGAMAPARQTPGTPRHAWIRAKKKGLETIQALGVGGGGGNRTRVQKPYTVGTTCLARSFGSRLRVAEEQATHQPVTLDLGPGQVTRPDPIVCGLRRCRLPGPRHTHPGATSSGD